MAYFPKEDDQEADLDKLIKHFKVNFLFEGDDLEAGGYAMGEAGQKGYVAVDPMLTRDGIKIAQTPNAATAKDPADIAKEVLEGPAGKTKKPKAKKTLEEEVTADHKQEAAKPADDKAVAAKAKPEAKPKPAKATPPKAVKPKPAPVVAKAPAPRKEASKAKPKATTKKAAPNIKLAFNMDDVFLDMETRRELAKFAKELRDYKDKIAGYNIMIRSYFGPNGDQTAIGRERLERVITFLRQQDVDVTAGIVTEIHVQTLKDQFVSIEPVSEGQS